MEEFKKYYKFPLVIDENDGNVISDYRVTDSEYIQCFDWISCSQISKNPISGRKGEVLAEHLVNVINGNTDYIPKFKWEADKENLTVINMDGEPCIQVRGWGMLRSKCGLDVDEAIKIQDDFKEYIINKLNGND